MEEDQFFTAQRTLGRSPTHRLGLIHALVGAVMVLTAGYLLYGSAGEVADFLTQDPEELVRSGSAVALLFSLAALVWIGLVGLRLVLDGIQQVGSLILPPGAPNDLDWTDQLEPALRRQQMPAYDQTVGVTYRWLRKLLPRYFPLMTSATRRFVVRGLGAVRGFLWFAVLVGGAHFGLQVAPADVSLLRQAVPPALGWIVAGLAGLAALRGGIAVGLIPDAAPRSDVSEFRAAIEGGGDPGRIPHELEQALGSMRQEDDAPNRVHRAGWEQEDSVEGESGTFEGSLLVETQPELYEHHHSDLVQLQAFAGVAVVVLFAAWLLGAPGLGDPAVAGLEDPAAVTLRWGGIGVVAIVLLSVGRRMTRQAAHYLQTMRFTSLGLGVWVEGNFSTSRVRVGRAEGDSIESDNTVVRSDVSVVGFAARLLTESAGAEGEREIIGMTMDQEVRDAEGMIRAWLEDFEERGATVVGVDLTDEKVSEMVRANLAVQAERSAATKEGELRAIDDHEEGREGRRLEDHAEEEEAGRLPEPEE